jgi:Uma2 family endonuclease
MEEVRMHPVVEMRDVWTVDDLAALGIEDWRRYEIVDGALVVSPTPGQPHAFVLERLHRVLIAAEPPRLMTLASPFGLPMERSYLIPDLLVVPADPAGEVASADVVLAVEVVSPGSMTMDRIVKPAKYAAAGIANYWRIEQSPLSLTAYRLAGDVYAEIGTWQIDETARLREPFPVEIEISRLVP